MGAASGRTTTAPKACIDALSALVLALRTIQISKGDRPWLVLDLTMAQLKALILLVQSGGLRSRDLADGLGIAPSAVTPLVDRLVDQKLVKRENDANDRRIVWIRPTAKAVTLHDKLMQTNRSVLAAVLDELPARERQRVYQSMLLLLDSAQRVLAGTAVKGGK
jgi:DNA-binding MarR family transcriptional regulator